MAAARFFRTGLLALVGVLATNGSISSAVAREASAPPHLRAAVALLSAIDPSDTNYQHKESIVHFPGDAGSDHAECRTDCSGLLDAVLERAYHLSPAQLSDWLDAKRPLATHYHAAIAAEHGFERIATLQDVRPGDILAVKFPPGTKGGDTGHVMIVAGTPHERTATVPLEGKTVQWEIPVIDESKHCHGTTDTRHRPDHTSADGLGRGVLRVYTDRQGHVAGYSWSIEKVSKFEVQSDRNMVIGRVDPAFIRSLKQAQ
jgi:hypothetical protein